MQGPIRTYGILIPWVCLALLGVGAAADSPGEVDLTELEIEDLLDLEITSVAKKGQSWRHSAAAVYVLTGDDLRRSGAATLPEALRRVPGLQAAQIDASKWAISSRGFNGQFANKFLVLIDGRSVYTPLFGGVFWEVQDTLLEDVERIEVIRGPGATLWGANAVNGVINIITKNASETEGGLVSVGGGGEDRYSAAVRYGAALGERGHYRIYAKSFDRDGSVDAMGEERADDWDGHRAGLRLDRRGPRDELMISADLYDLFIGQTGSVVSMTPPFTRISDTPIEASGGHLLGRFSRKLSEQADWALQLYYDRTEYSFSTFDDMRDTVDLDFQHRFPAGERHEVIWGLGLRRVSDELGEVSFADFEPDKEDVDLWSAFLQDEIRLDGERLRLILGAKLEYHDYTGFEIQPGVRALWSPSSRQTLWASVARAVRTPSRAETGVRVLSAVAPLGDGTPAFLTVFGDRSVQAEELLAFELGYRLQPSEALFIDIATFFNDYDQILSVVPGAPFVELDPLPHLILPIEVRNAQRGETSGLDASLIWDGGEGFRLSAGYSYFEMSLRPREGVTAISEEGDHPRHQAYLQASLDFARRGEWDFMLQWVDELENQDIASYLRVDLRLGWRLSPALEASLVLRNAFEEQHPEFRSSLAGTTILNELERSLSGKLTWSF